MEKHRNLLNRGIKWPQKWHQFFDPTTAGAATESAAVTSNVPSGATQTIGPEWDGKFDKLFGEA
jgi:hypothetical protein